MDIAVLKMRALVVRVGAALAAYAGIFLADVNLAGTS